MCECGCYINDIEMWLPAPDGGRYLITIGVPCEGCETPAGVIIERVSEDRAIEDMDALGVIRLDLSKPAAFPIMYPHKLFKQFMRVVCRLLKTKEYFSVPDDLWNRLEPFDPDEIKTALYDIFRSSIRAGARAAIRRASVQRVK